MCCSVQVTYTSEHFPALYELATNLIKAGDAYVDHQTAEEIKQYKYANVTITAGEASHSYERTENTSLKRIGCS